MTIWTIQEYTNADNQSGERIILLVAPLPAISASAIPAAVNTGLAIVRVTQNGISTSGSGFYDTPASMSAEPCRQQISAVLSGGVTVNSVTHKSATSVTLE